MKRLILMRHAKSDWSFSEPDHARPLNPRGIAAARALGQWVRDRPILPDEALVSTATRTRETFGLLGLDLGAFYVPRLYHADPSTMLSALREASGETVLMVGHNPGIAAFAHALVAAAPSHERFDDYPTGATLVARFDCSDWQDCAPGAAHAEAFIVPRDLPGQA